MVWLEQQLVESWVNWLTPGWYSTSSGLVRCNPPQHGNTVTDRLTTGVTGTYRQVWLDGGVLEHNGWSERWMDDDGTNRSNWNRLDGTTDNTGHLELDTWDRPDGVHRNLPWRRWRVIVIVGRDGTTTWSHRLVGTVGNTPLTPGWRLTLDGNLDGSHGNRDDDNTT